MCPSVCKSASLQGVGVYYNRGWKKRRDYNRHSVSQKNARSETKNATTESKDMEMEEARSELHWVESVCKRVRLCMQPNRGIHYHVLAFSNGLCRNDVPLWPACSSSGVKHNEVFVRECVCVHICVCVSSTNWIGAFPRTESLKTSGKSPPPRSQTKNWRLSTDLHVHTLRLPPCDSSTGSLSSLCFVWRWQTVQVAISPYHPPTAVSPYTTTPAKSVIFKLPWNIQYQILPCILLCFSLNFNNRG